MTKESPLRPLRPLRKEELLPELRAAIDATQDKKAVDVVVLDLRGIASFTDYFLVCSGTSQRQLQTIADGVEKALASMKRKPNNVEGYPRGEWILMDYVDFVVHLFTPASRAYYDLERLWGDARRLPIAEPGPDAVADRDRESEREPASSESSEELRPARRP